MLLNEILQEKAITSDGHSKFDKLVPFIVNKLQLIGIPAQNLFKKSRGTVRHVRLDISNPKDVFKTIGVKIEQLVGDKTATGQKAFTTYIGRLEADVGDFEKGDFFYIVNRHSEVSRIKGDMLTPTRIGLESKTPLTVSAIQKIVKAYLPTLEIFSDEELKYLNDLLKIGKADSYDIKAPETITSTELNKIAIAYGEVVGALWHAKQKAGTKTLFPSGNNPLIDFISVRSNGVQEPVSVKVGKGAPPSAAAIFRKIEEDRDYFDKTYGKSNIDVLEAVDELSVVDGVLKVHELLETDSYKAIMKIAKGAISNFNAKNVEAWLRSSRFKTADDLRDILDPFFEVNISRNENSAFDDIVKNDSRRVGLVSTPLGYNLVKLLNNKKEYKVFANILNDVTSRINVTQLYTNLTPSNISFIIKPFSSGEFLWEFNATARDPFKKKLSFRMK